MGDATEKVKPVPVFASNFVQLQSRTIDELLARMAKWQYQNATVQPVSVAYSVVGDWHTVVLNYIQPYDEELVA